MALTQLTVDNARKKDAPYRLSDERGLFLLVQPSGSRLWRWNYRFGGKQQTMAYGIYPDVTLKEARIKHAAARALLLAGRNPIQEKLKERAGALMEQAGGVPEQTGAYPRGSFGSVQKEWYAQWCADKDPRHARQVADRIKLDILPKLGYRPIAEIEAPELATVALAIEERGAGDLARRSLHTLSQIFRFGIVKGHNRRNPAMDIKARDFLKGVDSRNFARIDQGALPALLYAIEHYRGMPVTRIVLKLMVRTFLRTSELILSPWSEFDFSAGKLTHTQWTIPAERMKMPSPHIVPLSQQAVALFEELWGYTGETAWLFPSQTDPQKCMSKNTILAALESMGYKGKMTGHGFRGIASTILHEKGYDDAHIEIQLAHQERNSVKAAYNYAKYLEPRARMMQDWSDFLDQQLELARPKPATPPL